MPTHTISKQIIPELSDPFVQKSFLNRLYPAARRRAGNIKRWIGTGLQPVSNPNTCTPYRPMYLNFEREGTPPFSKKALIICESGGFFQTPEQIRQSLHVNAAETVEIACAFNRLGYSVDAMDVYDFESIPQNHYNVVFGEYYNYGRLLPSLPKETFKIFYATRSYWQAEHQAIEKRAKRIKDTRQAIIPIQHWEEANTWAEESDAVIVLGNKTTAATFTTYNGLVQMIDNCALYLPPPNLNTKNFEDGRKNFLWLGSWTLLRKGLDLVLEAFSTLPDLHLWICGLLDKESERDFVRAYRQELFHTPNIHPVGFIAPQSETMKSLMDKCAAMVFTSCSEGMSGGVLDSMAGGMIPILSKESGVDTESFGVTVEPCTVENIRTAVLNFASLPPETCRNMAQSAYHQTEKRYTLAAYRQNIEQLLKTVIERHERCSDESL